MQLNDLRPAEGSRKNRKRVAAAILPAKAPQPAAAPRVSFLAPVAARALGSRVARIPWLCAFLSSLASPITAASSMHL